MKSKSIPARRFSSWWIAIISLLFMLTLTLTATTLVAEAQKPEPGVIISAETVDVLENGGTATYTIKLATKPTHNVSVTVAAAPWGVVEVDPDRLIFTPDNWDQPQTVTVTGVDNNEPMQEEQTAKITHRSFSQDDSYYDNNPEEDAQNISIDAVAAILKNDACGNQPGVRFYVDQSYRLVTEGERVKVSVMLCQAGETDVTVRYQAFEMGGDFIADGDEGAKTLVIKAGKHETHFWMPTQNDKVHEHDGRIGVRALPGDGYAVRGDHAVIMVMDNDPMTTGKFVPNTTLVYEVEMMMNSANTDDAASARLSLVLGGMRGEAEGYTSSECRSVAKKNHVSSVWEPWCAEIERREDFEAAQPRPEVSISVDKGIQEGDAAVFTLMASPPPTADLTVNVTVSQMGDYGVITGLRTVSIGTSGTGMLTVPTTDDDVDELDGSLTATIGSGRGYTVSATKDAAAITIFDNDVPTVGISAGREITEGGDAIFTLTASPVPAADLQVNLIVNQSGDYGAATGPKKVIIGTSGTGMLTVPTTDDDVYELDGSVTATIHRGNGYTVSATQGEARVTVSDDDDQPVFAPAPQLVKAVEDKIKSAASNPAAVARLRQVLNGMTGKGEGYSSSTCEDVAESFGVYSAWKPWCAEIQRREEFDPTNPTTAPKPTPTTTPMSTPVVSISAGSRVTEGDTVTFTLTANPAPTADLSVSVTVSVSGDYGVTTGSRTVTIGTSGTRMLTVPTTGDDVDEPDGSITVTIGSGSGYTVSATQGEAKTTVSDDDVPPATTKFTPDATLVAQVKNAADNHSNTTATARLLRVLNGITGEGREEHSYTAAECRKVAKDFNVAKKWEPWCAEIERREKF